MKSKLFLLTLLIVFITTGAVSAAEISRDTLPAGTYQMTTIRNGKTTKLRVEDRQIQELEIDGRVIPPEEYPEHEEMVEGMIGGSGSSTGGGSFRFFFGDGEEGDDDDLDRGFFRMEESLENMERTFESMGESFSRIFRMDGDSSVFNFSFGNGESLDSLFRRQMPDRMRWHSEDDLDRIYSEEELLRDLESEERELQRLDEDIERLQREKGVRERELELKKKVEKNEAEYQNGSRSEQRKKLAEMRRENEERLAELRRVTEEEPDYGEIVEQLQNEGVLPNEALKKFVFTDDYLKFNGKKYTGEVYDRFAEAFEERYGKSIQSGTTVKIKNN